VVFAGVFRENVVFAVVFDGEDVVRCVVKMVF
jgi:hypothetical protein